MFVATFKPFVRSKSALCFATTVKSLSATLWKPWPRSRVAEAPGIPSIYATFAALPTFSAIS